MNPVLWKILLVDDDEDDYLLTRHMLAEARRGKITLDWASTYEAAEEALWEDDYDAVLMDYDLGPKTGIELTRSLVAHGYSAPIILLTGRGSYEVDLEAMQAGATLYLTKSETNPLLLERGIRYAIEMKQKEEALLVANQALRESEERLLLAARTAGFGMFDWDIDTDEHVWSQETYQIYGIDLKETITFERMVGAIHPEDREQVAASIAAGLDPAGPGDSSVEYRIIRGDDGQVRWVHLQVKTGYVGKGEERRANRVVGAVQDITLRKQAEANILESERRFHQLADAMPQLVWMARPDGTVDYFNQRYKEYSGVYPVREGSLESQADESSGAGFRRGLIWHWTGSVHPDDLPKLVQVWTTALMTGEPFECKHRMRMANGEYRWHLNRGVPSLDEQGEIVHWYGTATDIHETETSES